MTKAITPVLPVALLRNLPVVEQPRALLRQQPPRVPPPPASPSMARAPQENREAHPPVTPGSGALSPNSPGPSALPAYEQGYRAGLEAGRTAGHEQGRAEGLEQGLAEGRELGRQEVVDQAKGAREQLGRRKERFEQLAASLESQINEQALARLVASEDDMIALCHTVICRFLGDRLSSREGIAQSIRQSVQQCIGSGSHTPFSALLAIHVNPRDLQALKSEEGLSEWFSQHGVRQVPWLADESVRLGGCLVRSTQGSLDARLETQLAALQELLLKRDPSATPQSSSSPHAEAE